MTSIRSHAGLHRAVLTLLGGTLLFGLGLPGARASSGNLLTDNWSFQCDFIPSPCGSAAGGSVTLSIPSFISTGTASNATQTVTASANSVLSGTVTVEGASNALAPQVEVFLFDSGGNFLGQIAFFNGDHPSFACQSFDQLMPTWNLGAGPQNFSMDIGSIIAQHLSCTQAAQVASISIRLRVYSFDTLPHTVTYGNLSLIDNGPRAPMLTSLSVSAINTDAGTGSIDGTVTLDSPAPDGGADVTLNSSDPAVSISGPVTIPAGASSQSFTLFPHCVGSPTPATISAAYGGGTKSATVTLLPSDFIVTAVTLDSSSVVGGTPVNATVTLGSPAPPGASISVAPPACFLGCSPVVSVPTSISVPAGATSASFQIKTVSVTASQTVQLTVGPGCPPVMTSLTLNPDPNSGKSNQAPGQTGGTPPSGSSPPGQSKQFQLLFQGWSIIPIGNVPNGYLQVMQWQITNTGAGTIGNITVSTDTGFSQNGAPLSLDPNQTAIVQLQGPLLTTPTCNGNFAAYPVTLTVDFGTGSNTSGQQEHQVISGPPSSPGCPTTQ